MAGRSCRASKHCCTRRNGCETLELEQQPTGHDGSRGVRVVDAVGVLDRGGDEHREIAARPNLERAARVGVGVGAGDGRRRARPRRQRGAPQAGGGVGVGGVARLERGEGEHEQHLVAGRRSGGEDPEAAWAFGSGQRASRWDRGSASDIRAAG